MSKQVFRHFVPGSIYPLGFLNDLIPLSLLLLLSGRHLGLIVMHLFTPVSDKTRPTLSETFQDFGFFFDVNQTVTIASNFGGNGPIRFHPAISVFRLALKAFTLGILVRNLNLPCFIKNITKVES